MERYFDEMCKWEDLHEIKGMSLDEVLDWLKKKGIDIDLIDCGDEYFIEDVIANELTDFDLFLDGYWSDRTPVIAFEDYKVARWYRLEAWD